MSSVLCSCNAVQFPKCCKQSSQNGSSIYVTTIPVSTVGLALTEHQTRTNATQQATMRESQMAKTSTASTLLDNTYALILPSNTLENMVTDLGDRATETAGLLS